MLAEFHIHHSPPHLHADKAMRTGSCPHETQWEWQRLMRGRPLLVHHPHYKLQNKSVVNGVLTSDLQETTWCAAWICTTRLSPSGLRRWWPPAWYSNICSASAYSQDNMMSFLCQTDLFVFLILQELEKLEVERIEWIQQHLRQYTTLRHETDMFNQSVSLNWKLRKL